MPKGLKDDSPVLLAFVTKLPETESSQGAAGHSASDVVSKREFPMAASEGDDDVQNPAGPGRSRFSIVTTPVAQTTWLSPPNRVQQQDSIPKGHSIIRCSPTVTLGSNHS